MTVLPRMLLVYSLFRHVRLYQVYSLLQYIERTLSSLPDMLPQNVPENFVSTLSQPRFDQKSCKDFYKAQLLFVMNLKVPQFLSLPDTHAPHYDRCETLPYRYF